MNVDGILKGVIIIGGFFLLVIVPLSLCYPDADPTVISHFIKRIYDQSGVEK